MPFFWRCSNTLYNYTPIPTKSIVARKCTFSRRRSAKMIEAVYACISVNSCYCSDIRIYHYYRSFTAIRDWLYYYKATCNEEDDWRWWSRAIVILALHLMSDITLFYYSVNYFRFTPHFICVKQAAPSTDKLIHYTQNQIEAIWVNNKIK